MTDKWWLQGIENDDKFPYWTKTNILDYEEWPSISCIIDDFLFLGDLESINIDVITKFQITHIISLVSDYTLQYIPTYGNHLRISMDDDPRQPIAGIVAKTNAFIEKHKNKRVLVHCAAGISRSPTIVMAYLICHCDKTLQEAYEYVKERRQVICPNLGFMKQLNAL